MARTWTDAIAFRGIPLSTTAPTNGQIYSYNSSTNQWEPNAVAWTGTVTTLSIATANGVSGSVATATTTPVVTLTLWAITPSSIMTGTIVNKVLVSAQASSPVTVSATTDVNKYFTNEWATGAITFNLPTAAANLIYTFVVQDTDGITITANTGDTIRFGSTVTATAGSIGSTTIGSTITLVAINATEWLATALIWTWA